MNRFVLILLPLFYLATAGAQKATESSPIGYATVDEAFTALQADPSATMSEYEGWTIFNQKHDGVYTIWSFTPEDHATHPTVVRRDIARKDAEVFIRMNAICHSSKFDCDQLIEEFDRINEGIRQKLLAESQ
jgi:hypothetical protein